jgi:hypothetical protein
MASDRKLMAEAECDPIGRLQAVLSDSHNVACGIADRY